jgi:hypothetical protein
MTLSPWWDEWRFLTHRAGATVIVPVPCSLLGHFFESLSLMMHWSGPNDRKRIFFADLVTNKIFSSLVPTHSDAHPFMPRSSSKNPQGPCSKKAGRTIGKEASFVQGIYAHRQYRSCSCEPSVTARRTQTNKHTNKIA